MKPQKETLNLEELTSQRFGKIKYFPCQFRANVGKFLLSRNEKCRGARANRNPMYSPWSGATNIFLKVYVFRLREK